MPETPPLTSQQVFILALIVAVVPSLSTVIVTFMVQAFTWFTGRRAREIELEDRREVARQAKLAAAEATNLAKSIHTEVVKVGVQAELAYKEANFANLKIQAVQDALSSTLNIPTIPITASTGANEPRKET